MKAIMGAVVGGLIVWAGTRVPRSGLEHAARKTARERLAIDNAGARLIEEQRHREVGCRIR